MCIYIYNNLASLLPKWDLRIHTDRCRESVEILVFVEIKMDINVDWPWLTSEEKRTEHSFFFFAVIWLFLEKHWVTFALQKPRKQPSPYSVKTTSEKRLVRAQLDLSSKYSSST